MKEETNMVRNMTLACLMAIIMIAVMACGSDQGIIVDNDELPISEEDALRIAMMDLDPEIYTATSTITGPMEWNTEPITAYEVTVNGGDHLILRYVDGQTGDLYPELDVTHEIPIASDLTDGSNASYYTSCQSGWPLCLRTPSSITFYSQNDPGWACDYLGNSTSYTIGDGSYGAKCSHTMRASGCVLSAYAMSLCYLGKGCRSPQTLNSVKSYFSGAEISNDSFAKYYGASFSTIDTSKVWSTLASGIPVIVYGSLSSGGSNCHAQMLWGHDGSRYLTKDPWYDWPNQDQAMRVYTDSSTCRGPGNWRVLK